MDMPKQMGAGSADQQPLQRHQGETTENRDRHDPMSRQQLAETAAEQMRPIHFSDWASI